jgi:glycosyltransferase involved in cell wall biosynthesis
VRIGLDACCFVGSRTGIANYVEALLGSLCREQPEAHFFLYANDDGEFPSAPNIVPRIDRPKRRGPIWHNTHLVRRLCEDAVDVFWGTNGLIPLRGLERTATVVTVHDLAHRFVPRTQRRTVRWKQRLFQPLCVRAADRVVAVSRATAADVETHYGRTPDAVIEPCAAASFGAVNGPATEATLRAYGLASGYLLAVGTLEPRKNLLALVEAYVACTASGTALPPLVIAGGPGWHDAPLRARLADPVLAGRVRWLGFVPNAALVHLYARCHAFLMPSLYEGYGMPVLEAQLCGAPVVHGVHHSMVEAAGGVGVAVETSREALRASLEALARGELPLVSRLRATIRNDVDASARRLWQLMAGARAVTSSGLAGQLA